MSEATISPKQAAKLIRVCMDSGRPVMLAGSPGIGKSDLMEQIGKGYETRNEAGEVLVKARPVVDMRLLLMEPTDLKGIPFYDQETKTMKWAQSSELPTEQNGMENAILFLDEINAAPPSVQAAAYQLVLNRRVGEYHLPKGVSIVAAGNKESDRGVVYRMPSPLANRFVHLNLEANFEDWQEWALMNNIHEDVVGFLSKHSSKLFNFDPKSPDKAFATPRSWAFVSDIVNQARATGLDESSLNTIVAGTIGDGLATEFNQHRKYASQLPDPIDVLKGKVRELKCQEVSAHYSLVISLCYRLKELRKVIDTPVDVRTAGYEKFDNDEWHSYVDNYFKFMLDNLQPEMIILGCTTALRKNMFNLPVDHRNKNIKYFKEIYKEYGDMMLGQ